MPNPWETKSMILGKLQYVTNLNSSAIKGDDSHYSPMISSEGEQGSVVMKFYPN